MTVEELHDALTLLPADLVAEAEKRRSRRYSRKHRVIRWQRLAAMAACMVLVLCAGRFCMALFGPKGKSADVEMAEAAAEAVMQDAPAEAPAAMIPGEGCGENGDAAFSIGTGALDESLLPPGVLDAIWVETPVPTAASVSGAPVVRALVTSREALDSCLEDTLWDMEALREVCAGWDEEWFEGHDLLMVALAAAEGNTELAIREEEGQWVISVPEPAPEPETKFYHILIVTEKEWILDADAVTVGFE